VSRFVTRFDFKTANGRQRKALRVAITSVFNKKDLTRFLDEDMELGLEELVADDKFANMVYELIGDFVRRGRLQRFMDLWIGSEEFGKAPDLSDLLNNWAVFGTSSPEEGEPPIEIVETLPPVAPPAGTAPPTLAESREEEAPADALESFIDQGVGRKPAAVWLKDMAALSRQVCMILDGENRGTGTGFLIGPRHVLTAAHVVHVVHAGQQAGQSLSVMFDHNGDERIAPTVIEVAKLVVGDPDIGVHADAPDWFQTLDFVVLELAADPPDVDGTSRGWIDFGSVRSRLHPGEPVMTLVHLEGRGLSVETGEVANPPTLKGRFGHDANTMAGASGAPILDARLRLIGMHEAGLRPTGETPKMNYAIRADAIARALDAKGYKFYS
jgi:Trypsin-like peptidase domain